MMLRDEAVTLPLALERARPLCDEFICGIDDTSKDETEEIAQAFLKEVGAGEVFRFTWPDHFANARNAVLRKATGDWILSIDGHEIFQDEHAQGIRNLLEDDEWERRADLIEVKLQLDEGDKNFAGYQVHLYRRHPEIYYVNQQHNKLKMMEGAKQVRLVKATLDHVRTDENRARRKIERDEMIMRVMPPRIEKDPNDGQAMYYLAQTYDARNEWDKALEWYERQIALGEPKDLSAQYERAKVLSRMGFIHLEHDKLEAARECFLKAFGTRSDVADSVCGLGDVEAARDNYEGARTYYDMARTIAPPASGIFFSADFYTWLPALKCAAMYENAHQWENAILYGQAAVAEPSIPDERREIVRAGIDDWVQRALAERRKRIERVDDKPHLVVFDQFGQFTPPLIKHWNERFHVKVSQRFTPSLMSWADVAWFEWCDQSIAEATKVRHPDVKIICRLHRYERFNGSIGSVNWNHVDRLVMYADHVERFVQEHYPMAAEVVHIPLGIDLGKFKKSDPGHGPNIAMVGFLNERKGVRVMLEMAAQDDLALAYQFHLVGQWQDPALQRWCEHFIHRNGLTNVHFYPWTDDVAGWHEKVDTNYLLSLSTDESFHFSVGEAMAMGIRPMILEWPGATDLWPSEDIYSTANDIVSALAWMNRDPESKYEMLDRRKWVADRYDIKAQFRLTDALLDELLAERVAA